MLNSSISNSVSPGVAVGVDLGSEAGSESRSETGSETDVEVNNYRENRGETMWNIRQKPEEGEEKYAEQVMQRGYRRVRAINVGRGRRGR